MVDYELTKYCKNSDSELLNDFAGAISVAEKIHMSFELQKKINTELINKPMEVMRLGFVIDNSFAYHDVIQKELIHDDQRLRRAQIDVLTNLELNEKLVSVDFYVMLKNWCHMNMDIYNKFIDLLDVEDEDREILIKLKYVCVRALEDSREMIRLADNCIAIDQRR